MMGQVQALQSLEESAHTHPDRHRLSSLHGNLRYDLTFITSTWQEQIFGEERTKYVKISKCGSMLIFYN